MAKWFFSGLSAAVAVQSSVPPGSHLGAELRVQTDCGDSWEVVGDLQLTDYLSSSPCSSCFKVRTPCLHKPYSATVLLAFLKHGTDATLGNVTEKTHRWHVKGLHVASKPPSKYHCIRELSIVFKYRSFNICIFFENEMVIIQNTKPNLESEAFEWSYED